MEFDKKGGWTWPEKEVIKFCRQSGFFVDFSSLKILYGLDCVCELRLCCARQVAAVFRVEV